MDALVADLQTLIRQPSVSAKKQGLVECANLVSYIMKKAGISLFFGPPTANLLISILLSPYFRVSLIVAAAILAGGITAQHMVGPIKRMEQWLLDYEAGFTMRPLRVRSADKFERFVELVNKILGSSLK